jgi:hypothetical protein
MFDTLRMGTFGGTILCVFLQISSKNFIETVVLAAVGAVASFGISYFLRSVFEKDDHF